MTAHTLSNELNGFVGCPSLEQSVRQSLGLAHRGLKCTATRIDPWELAGQRLLRGCVVCQLVKVCV